MIIQPVNIPGDGRTGGLSSDLTAAQITAVLGFGPNVNDDPAKVRHSWGFTIDGARCGIWDYKGSRWSTFGPADKFAALFPGKVTQ